MNLFICVCIKFMFLSMVSEGRKLDIRNLQLHSLSISISTSLHTTISNYYSISSLEVDLKKCQTGGRKNMWRAIILILLKNQESLNYNISSENNFKGQDRKF